MTPGGSAGVVPLHQFDSSSSDGTGAADGRGPEAALKSTTPPTFVTGDSSDLPATRKRPSIFVRRHGRRARRRGPVDLPLGYRVGMENWAGTDPTRALTVSQVIACGKRGWLYRCIDNGHLSYSPGRCSFSDLCPSCGRRDSDKAAQLAAADFAEAAAGIRGRRDAGGPAADLVDHRLALVGVVATIPRWLERWIRPGDDAASDRLWSAFARFVSRVFPGTGTFAGLDWWGEKDSRVRPHIDARLLNVTRYQDDAGAPRWSTFPAKMESCIKHDRSGKPRNGRKCTDAEPCEFHRLHVEWSAALRRAFEPTLPAPLDGEVRSWDSVVNVRFDRLEIKGSRHAPELAADWENVLNAKCSYSAKPPAEVVAKWSTLEIKEGRPGVVPVEVFDALRALRGSSKNKGARRIRRFGWMSPSVRRSRLAELGREVAPLSDKIHLLPTCGAAECDSPAEKSEIGEIETRDPRCRDSPLLRWLTPEERQAIVRPKPPPRPERPGRTKTVKRCIVIEIPPDPLAQMFGAREPERLGFAIREVVKVIPKESVDPWICCRCGASIYTRAPPRWCLLDHGGCGRPTDQTAFARRPKWKTVYPYSWWISERRAALESMTREEFESHDQHSLRDLARGDCALCVLDSAKRIDDRKPDSSTEDIKTEATEG